MKDKDETGRIIEGCNRLLTYAALFVFGILALVEALRALAGLLSGK